MAAKIDKKTSVRPRSRPAPLVSLRAAQPRPQVRRWLQSFLLDGVF